jgi:hypothetical protein
LVKATTATSATTLTVFSPSAATATTTEGKHIKQSSLRHRQR